MLEAGFDEGKSWCKYWLSSSYRIPSLTRWFSDGIRSSKFMGLSGHVSVYGGGKLLMILLDVLVLSKEWIWQYELSSSKSIAETIAWLCGTVDPELEDDACSRITL